MSDARSAHAVCATRRCADPAASLARSQPVSNLPIDELYEHVVSHEVPIEEWPQWILQRYGHG